MPPKKSNAEPMRRYRARKLSDPTDHEEYKRKERERYQRRKQTGKIIDINLLTSREQRSLRKKWKVKHQQRRKQEKSVDKEVIETPPQSPLSEERVLPLSQSPRLSHQRIAGRRKMRKESRKAYRTINKQKETIERLTKQVNSMKVKLRRAQTQSTPDEKVSQKYNDIVKDTSESPASKAENLLQSTNRKLVKKQLTFGFAICDGVREKLKNNAKKHKDKQTLHRILTGALLKKYRLIARARQQINLTQRELKKAADVTLGKSSLLEFKRKQTQNPVADTIEYFYLQDLNSHPAAGKRETITRNKVKMQKRYMCDTMLNLHEKFQAEHPDVSASYTTFTRLRPFYVVAPNVHNRDTVKCKLHHNCELKAVKLYQEGVLLHKDSYNIIKSIVFDSKQKDCMYLECKTCNVKWNDMYKDLNKKESSKTVTFFEWQRKDEERTNTHGQQIFVNVVKKVEKMVPISTLCTVFEKDLAVLMPHQYRISHQYKATRGLKQQLKADECVLQIDFSENYACKAETEIQSMHFGGSRKQISLHTCHATLKDSVNCYCTISEDIRHSAVSVWTHLTPVLDDLSNSGIKVLHFVSDGPTTQYRNKTNFYLFTTLPFIKWNFSHLTYIFLESNHGKGPADGIRAAIKNCADQSVAHGEDILDSKQLIESVSNKVKVKMFEIIADQINEMDEITKETNIQAVKGTMKIHQLMVCKEHSATLFHRQLSCFCKVPSNTPFCMCYNRSQYQVSQVDNDASRMDEQHTDTDSECEPAERNIQQKYKHSIADPKVNAYYAVFFHSRGSKKGTYYVGRMIKISEDSQFVEMKFLERKCGTESINNYDWPRRDDISTVHTSFIIQGLEFHGPPPFHLNNEQHKIIQDKISEF